MTEWTKYRRTNLAEMRPLRADENFHTLDHGGVSISAPDRELDEDEFQLGFVARNPVNHDDKWYVARAYFDANFEPIS